MTVRNGEPGGFGVRGNLVILGEPSGMGSPGKGSLHNPAFRCDFSFIRLDSLSYVAFSVAFAYMGNKGSTIPPIAGYPLDRWIRLDCFIKGIRSTFGIVYICSMNDDGKQVPHRVRHDVTLSALRFFPPSIPRSWAAYIVFVLCESIIEYVGSGLRPASTRLFSTNSARIRSHKPLAMAR